MPDFSAERCPQFDTEERPSTLIQGQDHPD